MKDITKKIIAVLSVVCVAASCLAGCGSKGKSSETSEEAPKQYPLEIGSAQDANAITEDKNKPDLNAEDPTQASGSVEDTTEIQDVTDAQGQPVTESVTVTDASGKTVTDAAGQPVTEMVKVTTIVKKSGGGTSGGTSGSNNTTTQSGDSSYTTQQDGRYAMWLDISKDENFFFEGDFLHVKFKIKDNTPDGDYKIKISPDLSDVAGKAVYPSKVMEGTIRVNNGTIQPADVSNETGMVFYGDNVACKQGDTIDYYINVKNNSGLVAFVIWFYFDSNAMDFISAEASGEFEEIARNTEIGKGNKVSE
jgi:hypothetical protein